MRHIFLIFLISTLLVSCNQGKELELKERELALKEKEFALKEKDTAVTISPFIPLSTYSLPKELLYTGKREKGDFPGPLYPTFFPIGWSRDGKFAYVEEPVDEACGCYFFNIYIQDMNSDKIIWHWNFKGEEGDGMNLENIWKKNAAMFTEKLNNYQISPSSFNAIEKLPVVFNNNVCSFKINNNTFFNKAYDLSTIIGTTVSLRVNGIEKKKIFSDKYTLSGFSSTPYSMTFSNKILGYLKNPFENRIALFYMVETRGWEGPPNVMSFQFIGCDLENISVQSSESNYH